MKKLLILLITSTILLSCGKSTIEVKGTVVGEDKVELNTLQKVMTDMHECNLYMIETADKETYFAMTPSLSVDPLDSGYVGTFVLSDVVTKGTSEDYVDGTLTKTRHEFRNLISYLMYNLGDRVIVRPYEGWEYSGIIVGRTEATYDKSVEFYYKIERYYSRSQAFTYPRIGSVSNVNPIKVIGLDKEWYRDININKVLDV